MNIDQQKLDELMLRAVGDLSAGYAGVMVSLGHKLGLYTAMHGAGPLTAAEVARRAGCNERYVREWLHAQVAGRYVDYHPVSGSFELTPEQALVLADASSPTFLPPAWQVPASMWFDEEKSLAAFRSGEGVAWGDHDTRLFCGSAAFYRNTYRGNLVQHWLPALDGVVEKLERGAVVADVGCGHGHSSILLAQAFPRAHVHGYDVHAGSLDEARVLADEAGVRDRVHFVEARAVGYAGPRFDLICFFDCLHDMGHPLAAVSHAKSSLAPGGTVMVIEPFANDRLEDNINPVARIYYAASTTLCCAHAMSEQGTHVLGAQAGERRIARLFQQAGFQHFRRAAETPFNLVFEARV